MTSLSAIGRICTASSVMNMWTKVSRPFGTLMSSPAPTGPVNTSPLPVLSSGKLLTFTQPPLITQCAGMKVMGLLRKRCKYCFFIMIDERLHVWCDVHPRHKQMQMVKKPKSLLRVCSVSQHKIRPW